MLMNDDQIRIWKGVVLAYLKLLSLHSLGEAEANYEKVSQDNPAEIQTGYLLNTSPLHHPDRPTQR
jgi:hypothetical protein